MNKILAVIVVIFSLVVSAYINKDAALVWFVGAVTGFIVSVLAVLDAREE